MAQTPAFPGAFGFGADATGGRGGTVYHVTTLADSGPGSFRDAVSHSGRIIVFDVGGTITLDSAVSCANNLTIAGQTAPGGGIAIIGHEVSFSARRNEIVRYLRIRPGSLSSSGEDAINVGDGTNMIFDHCSFEFAGYNNIDAHGANGCDAITIQNSIIGDPMYNGTSAKQGFGAHTEHLGGKFSWFYNLWVSEHNRQPLAKIDTIFVNNTEYNFQAGYTVADTSGHFNHDIINNYFITGPTDPSGGNAFFQMNANQSIYSIGNLRDNNNDGVLNGSSISPGGGGTVLSAPWSPLSTNAVIFSTAGAARYDISQSGVLPRDQLDGLILSQVKTFGNGPAGTGAGTAGPGSSLYYDQTSTGLGNNGYGVVSGGLPAADSDGDGMPDYWEKAVGLNYLSPTDAMTIGPDGYANIERYLNWLAGLHAMTVTNAPVAVNLWQYTSGFTNASPVYSLDNASNGVVTLDSGHIAQFTPTTDFQGLGSFQFSVIASDGSAYTNTVQVLVTPQTQTTALNLVWVGDGVSNLWAVGSGTNWFDGTNDVAFDTGDNVVFDDSGSDTPAIALSGILAPGSVSVLADQDYTFAGGGALTGPGTLLKVGAGTLFINTTNSMNGGATITEGTVQFGDGVSANGTLAGNITNNDTLVFDNPGDIAGSMSISGSGVLVENGPGTMTLNGTQTYTNSTTINSGGLQFSGSIPPGDILDNGSLVLAPSGSVTVNNFISGSGAVTVNASGPTTLSGSNTYSGGTTNASGTLNVANNSAIGTGPVTYLSGSVHLANGTVITNTFVVPSSTSDSMMDCVSGTATWAGNVVLTGGGAQFRPSGINGTLILTGNGSFGGRNFIIPRGSVYFASNAVFSASGSASSFDRNTTHNSAFVTLEDNASVSFAQLSLGGGKATGGRMILTIRDAANLSVSGNFDLHDSTASSAISSVHLDGGILTVGGFIKTSTGSSQLATNFFNGGTLKAYGDNASFLPALSGFKGVVESGGAIIDDGGYSITIAAPLVHDSLFGATDGGLTKLGAGTLTLAGFNTYNGDTIVSNGTLAITSTAPILGSMNMVVAAGATLDVSGGSGGGLAFGTGRKLSGDGTVHGNMTLNSGATLAPSGSLGTLTFNNSLVLNPGCTNIFEITQSPLTNDVVNCLGQATLGGTLIVTNAGATPLAAGDTFQLFKAAGFNGAFSNVELPGLPAGLAWDTNSLNSAGMISIVVTNTPVFGAISVSSSGLAFSGASGVGNANFILLGSTNLTAPFDSWTPLLTNHFDNNGNFNFTNALNTAAPQTFYRLQLQ